MQFNVFVASPEIATEHCEIARFRAHVRRTATVFEQGGLPVKFHFYEDDQNPRLPGKTICESIFERMNVQFDAFYFFFADRVGEGTSEELEYFKTYRENENPACQLWWSQIYTPNYPQETHDFIGRLQEYGTQLPSVTGEELIEKPDHLAGQLTVQVCKTIQGLTW